MLRVGMIGCGSIAQVHGWALQRTDNVWLVACTDIEKQKAQALADQYEKIKVYTDYIEMLQSENLDAVHICTPHFLHIPMVIEALERNISVFCEKPPAISRKQWKDLQEVAKLSYGKIGFCFQNRYNATTKTLDELVNSKKYGKIIGGRAFVTWRRDKDYYMGNPWKGRWNTEGGGTLMNQSIHTLDLLLRYLGEPVRVQASLQNHHTYEQIEVEDTVEAWMEFEGEKRACFYASNAYVADVPILLELQCELGRLTMLEQSILVHTETEDVMIHCHKQDMVGKDYWGNGHLACIQDFYRCLEQNQRFQNDMQGVQNTLFTTLKIYEKGRKI